MPGILHPILVCLCIGMSGLGAEKSAQLINPLIVIWPPPYPGLINPGGGSNQTKNQAPVADAGKPIYVGREPITLNGLGSYDPDGPYETLTYRWRQTSGPGISISGAETPTPTLSAQPTSRTQRVVLALTVSDGRLESQASEVDVTILPDYGDVEFTLMVDPFDVSKPTVVSFGGGNCVKGGRMRFISYLTGIPSRGSSSPSSPHAMRGAYRHRPDLLGYNPRPVTALC